MDISYYKDKVILITGGAGYLGSSIINALSFTKCRIIALDIKGSVLNTMHGKAANVSLEYVDIRNKDTWLKFLKGAHVVFHLAAQTSSRIANENPVKDMEVNLLPIAAMIEVCYKNKLRPDIIFAGTVTQVGLTDKCPVDEKFKDNPVTIYDINKLAAEKYLQYYSNQMGRMAATLRLANVYGPGTTSSNADRNILNAMVKKALKGEVLTIYGEGAFIRDYVYIDDVVRAFLIAGAKMDKLAGNYYVIGTGIGYSIKDMVNTVKSEAGRRTDKEVQVNHVPSPEGLSPVEFRNFIANANAFKHATGWMAEVSLQEGIKRTIDFFSGEAKA